MNRTKDGIILPNGFSPQGMKRLEKAMADKAIKAAAQLPQLPPELGAQIAQGIGMATQGKVSQLMIGMNTPQGTAQVRVMIFRDELFEQIEKGRAQIAPIAPIAPTVDEVAQKVLAEAESKREYEVSEPKEGEQGK